MLYGINRTFRSRTLCLIGYKRKKMFLYFFVIRVCACSIVRILATTSWKICWSLGTFCSDILRFNYEGKMVQTAMFAVCTEHTKSGGGGNCFPIFNESKNRCIKIYLIVKQCTWSPAYKSKAPELENSTILLLCHSTYHGCAGVDHQLHPLETKVFMNHKSGFH